MPPHLRRPGHLLAQQDEHAARPGRGPKGVREKRRCDAPGFKRDSECEYVRETRSLSPPPCIIARTMGEPERPNREPSMWRAQRVSSRTWKLSHSGPHSAHRAHPPPPPPPRLVGHVSQSVGGRRAGERASMGGLKTSDERSGRERGRRRRGRGKERCRQRSRTQSSVRRPGLGSLPKIYSK